MLDQLGKSHSLPLIILVGIVEPPTNSMGPMPVWICKMIRETNASFMEPAFNTQLNKSGWIYMRVWYYRAHNNTLSLSTHDNIKSVLNV